MKILAERTVASALLCALLSFNSTVFALPPEVEKLIQEDKYIEALARVEVLLKARPDDAELKKLRADLAAQLPKIPAETPAPAPGPRKLTGEDRLLLDTLTDITDELDKTVAPAKRAALLEEFLTYSGPFLQRAPDHAGIWATRALAGMELDRIEIAGPAGRELKRLGALESEDARIRKVMAGLNRKGWLDEKKMAHAAAAREKFAGKKGKDMKLAFGTDVEMELVWVDAGYWVGKYEVTQEEYEAVIGSNPAMYRGKRRPVEQVSWDDAMEFCKKVTAKQQEDGALPKEWVVTLPTEKQWEYFVSDATLADAVYDRYNGNISEMSQQRATVSVGSKGANRLGLYDVRGNVWEWCADWYDSKKETRVLRGASWDCVNLGILAVSSRSRHMPGVRRYGDGFRVVVVSVGGGVR